MSQSIDLVIKNLRNDYSKMALDRDSLNADPIIQFESWFENAVRAKLLNPQSMNIATVDSTGQPSVRVVFLRGFGYDGFRFFTNYLSAKGHDLEVNNKVSTNFFWPELERQIKIKGTVEKLSEKDSDIYFDSRPRDSQIGAWTSEQSTVIENRKVLENRENDFENKFKDNKVDRPKHWGGYLIKPHLIEFWQGRLSRLHDRFQYSLQTDGCWKIERLAP